MITRTRFLGWSVAWAAFTIAMFAWGVGFYGPPVFLQTLHASRGWPIAAISTAVSAHFLVSAVVIVFLPELHRRFGLARTTMIGAAISGAGVVLWSRASEPAHLFAAAGLTGIGWALTSGAALNAMIAPWFDRDRPKALSLAFNGASVGGVVFAPLWVTLIGQFGFAVAAAAIGATFVVVVGGLSHRFLRRRPGDLGLNPDGDAAAPPRAEPARALSRLTLVRDRRFFTNSAAFALGLFAQVGLLAHLIVRLSPELGTGAASAAVSLATVCAVLGRTVLGWWIGTRDRRVAAAANFAVQASGVLLLAYGSSLVALALGCVLFGLGLGNLTSLPPLIAQQEFERADVGAVVALLTAINQAVFAFAPATFGALRETTADYTAAFTLAAVIQICAAGIILSGGRRDRGLPARQSDG